MSFSDYPFCDKPSQQLCLQHIPAGDSPAPLPGHPKAALK